MSAYRRVFFSWLLLCLTGFAALPLLNQSAQGWNIPLRDTTRSFSLNRVEGWLNYALYRAGVSGDYNQIVVGRDGWLFLGDAHSQVLSKTRGAALPVTTEPYIQRSVEVIGQTQRWLEALGIPSLFVVAPNKHTIYPEYLPPWVKPAANTATDVFVSRARQQGVRLLDLRPLLLAAKPGNPLLYFPRGSHWTNLGAALSYQEILRTFNQAHGTELKPVRNLDTRGPPERGDDDLTTLIKIQSLFPTREQDPRLVFEGSQRPVCVQYLKNAADLVSGQCTPQPNLGFDIHGNPGVVRNPEALNPEVLLWPRDSFGNAQSRLFQGGFSEVWQATYELLAGPALWETLKTIHPDLVLYQVIERHLLLGLWQKPSFGALELLPEFYAQRVLPRSQLRYDLLQDPAQWRELDWVRGDATVGLALDNAGGYPRLNLPPLEFAPTAMALLEVELEAPRPSVMQLWHRATPEALYDPAWALKTPLAAGRHTQYFMLEGWVLRHGLRYTPSAHPGQYRLYGFKVYQVGER